MKQMTKFKEYVTESNKCATELEKHGYLLWGCFNDPEDNVHIEKNGVILVYKNYIEAHSHLIINKFHNGDLSFEIEKIMSFDTPISISKEYDKNLDYPYAIDVEDGSYFYAEQKKRDEDYQKLKLIVPQFSFC